MRTSPAICLLASALVLAVTPPAPAADPEPRAPAASSTVTAALFLGFRDNALDFELRAWTERYERSPAVRSELAVTVNDALAGAGIMFPVPPRDPAAAAGRHRGVDAGRRHGSRRGRAERARRRANVA